MTREAEQAFARLAEIWTEQDALQRKITAIGGEKHTLARKLAETLGTTLAPWTDDSLSATAGEVLILVCHNRGRMVTRPGLARLTGKPAADIAAAVDELITAKYADWVPRDDGASLVSTCDAERRGRTR